MKVRSRLRTPWSSAKAPSIQFPSEACKFTSFEMLGKYLIGERLLFKDDEPVAMRQP